MTEYVEPGEKPRLAWRDGSWVLIPIETRVFWEVWQPYEKRASVHNLAALSLAAEMNERLRKAGPEVDRVTESIEADALCTCCKHTRAAHLCQPGGVQWICLRRGCDCANFQEED